MVTVASCSACISAVSPSIICRPSIHSSITPNCPPRLGYLAGQPSRSAIAITASRPSTVAMAAWVAVRPLARYPRHRHPHHRPPPRITVALPESEADRIALLPAIYTGFDRIAPLATLVRSTRRGE